MHRILALLVLLGGCGGDDDGGGVPDASADAFESTCGEPGDTGNSIGVGKFCDTISDCSGNGEATLCSSLGDQSTHFCTKICNSDAGPADCGEGATCVCASAGCGCTPMECL